MIKQASQSYVDEMPFKKYFQFKITLAYVVPVVWRRIQVPKDYFFWDLHVAITDCMPWLDYHLHDFIMLHPKKGNEVHIGMPDQDDDMMGYETLEDGATKIASYFSLQNPMAKYLYDFGDGWEHEILLEKICDREDGVNYPRCVAGENACPPEDVGGVGGYGQFLKTIKDTKNKEREDLLRWAEHLTGKYPFDPECFDPEDVHFDDPAKRWAVAFEGEEMTPDMRCYIFGK